MLIRPNKLILAILVILPALLTGNLFAADEQQQESDQQVNDFSIAGYGERGKKSWDIAGSSADISTDNVKLKDVKGNLYGEEENIQLTSERGDFNKAQGKVHLEKDVVITTSSGAQLTTDTLDWDRKNNKVSTNDKVNIVRDNMMTQAIGAEGHPDLGKVELKQDVKVDILPKEEPGKGQVQEKVTITCDGPLSVDYEKNIATFNNNVKVERSDSIIYSDKMDIYFLKTEKAKTDSLPAAATKENKDKPAKEKDQTASKIDKIVARGNVKIVRGENVSYSDEAIYDAAGGKIVLAGRPKLVIFSTEDMKNAPLGN